MGKSTKFSSSSAGTIYTGGKLLDVPMRMIMEEELMCVLSSLKIFRLQVIELHQDNWKFFIFKTIRWEGGAYC